MEGSRLPLIKLLSDKRDDKRLLLPNKLFKFAALFSGKIWLCEGKRFMSALARFPGAARAEDAGVGWFLFAAKRDVRLAADSNRFAVLLVAAFMAAVAGPPPPPPLDGEGPCCCCCCAALSAADAGLSPPPVPPPSAVEACCRLARFNPELLRTEALTGDCCCCCWPGWCDF